MCLVERSFDLDAGDILAPRTLTLSLTLTLAIALALALTDLDAGDVFAPGDDDVLAPVLDVHVAVRIPGGEIP